MLRKESGIVIEDTIFSYFTDLNTTYCKCLKEEPTLDLKSKQNYSIEIHIKQHLKQL